MRTLDTRCDSLTKAVKEHLTDQSVVFIHAFSAEKIQFPPNKFLVSVSLNEIGEENYVADPGGIIRASLTYRVYAPRDTHEAKLCQLCENLSQAICAKGCGVVDTVSISGVSYDTKARCMYREIKTRISYPKEVIL